MTDKYFVFIISLQEIWVIYRLSETTYQIIFLIANV